MVGDALRHEKKSSSEKNLKNDDIEYESKPCNPITKKMKKKLSKAF